MKRILAPLALLIGMIATMGIATPAHASDDPPPHFISYNSYSGLCMALQNPDASFGSPIVENTCTGNPDQLWVYHADTGFLVNYHNGECATIVASTANGAVLQNHTCADNVSHGVYDHWTHRSDNSLYNRDTGKCLIDFGFSRADGGGLGQWDCFPSADQQWNWF